jgi:predicted ArsR family transcriptional regulator
VSDAVRPLEEAGLVAIGKSESQKEGRPALRYRLASTAPEVLARLEARRRAALAAEAAALDELRALASRF